MSFRISRLLFADCNSYLKQLLEENQRLKRTQTAGEQIDATRNSGLAVSGNGAEVVDNPLIEENAWFVPQEIYNTPVFVGEANCTAFSSRFQQVLLNTHAEIHTARSHYVKDAQLLTALSAEVNWPSRAHALLLIETAIGTIGKCYYLSLSSSLRASLERAYSDQRRLDQLTVSKLFAMFALGELYAIGIPARSDDAFPGLGFFSRASSILRLLPERATMDHIEVLIMFVSSPVPRLISQG